MAKSLFCGYVSQQRHPYVVCSLHLHNSTLQYDISILYLAGCCYVESVFWWGCEDRGTHAEGIWKCASQLFRLWANVFLSYTFSIFSDKLSHYSFSPFVLLFTSCSLADLRLLTWSSLNIRRLTLDYFLRIKWIGPGEIRKVLLVNAKHVVLDATSPSESVVSRGGHVVVCTHSFKKAFHTQCCHTFKTDSIKKMFMSNLCQCVSRTGKWF